MNEIRHTLIGQEIKRIRLEKGIIRCEFSKRIGISDRHMSRIENTGQKLSIQLIKKIAEELNISDVYLCALALNHSDNVSQEQLLILESVIQTIFK